MGSEHPSLPPELYREARRNPGGWVYEIAGEYGPDDDVPPEAIRGAWRISDAGDPVEYIPNPNFKGPKDR